MVDSDPCSAAEKLRIALSLFEAGEAMMRARLRRERPLASDAEIDEAVLTCVNTFALSWIVFAPTFSGHDAGAPRRRRRRSRRARSQPSLLCEASKRRQVVGVDAVASEAQPPEIRRRALGQTRCPLRTDDVVPKVQVGEPRHQPRADEARAVAVLGRPRGEVDSGRGLLRCRGQVVLTSRGHHSEHHFGCNGWSVRVTPVGVFFDDFRGLQGQ